MAVTLASMRDRMRVVTLEWMPAQMPEKMQGLTPEKMLALTPDKTQGWTLARMPARLAKGMAFPRA
jgi:hypothetical protein